MSDVVTIPKNLFRFAVTVVAVAAIGAGAFVAGVAFSGRVPRPDDGARLRVVAGKEYASALPAAWAFGIRESAKALESGKTVAQAQDVAQAAFKSARDQAYAKYVAPRLNDVVPERDPLTDPIRRAALVAALRDVAKGASDRDPEPLPPYVPPVPPPDITPERKAEDAFDPPPRNYGWLDQPRERQALLDKFPCRTLSEVAPDFFATDNDKDVYLYRAWINVLGDSPRYVAQQIGDCTSFGAGHALDLLQCIDIVVYGFDPKGYKETCTEAIYGLSREAAGLLGRSGDGSFGVATAKALTSHGAVPREMVGAYSGKRAREWGYKGVPPEIRAESKKSPLKSATLVTTLPEADAALTNGYPIVICSSQGFTMRRDSTGLCEASGTWYHCMFIAGRRKINGEVQYLICQSWGPNVPSGPVSGDQPDFSFWARASVIGGILRQKDSFVFSNFKGFGHRALPSNWRYAGFARITMRNVAVMPIPTVLIEYLFREMALAARREDLVDSWESDADSLV